MSHIYIESHDFTDGLVDDLAGAKRIALENRLVVPGLPCESIELRLVRLNVLHFKAVGLEEVNVVQLPRELDVGLVQAKVAEFNRAGR